MLNTHCLSVSIGQLQLQVPGAGKQEYCTYEWVHLTVVSCCGKGMKHLCLMPLKLCQMASPDRSTRWVLQTGSSLYLVICTASLSNTNKTSVSIQLSNLFSLISQFLAWSYYDDRMIVRNLLVFVEVGETLRELHFKSRILPGFQGIVGLLVIFNGLGVVLGVGEAA